MRTHQKLGNWFLVWKAPEGTRKILNDRNTLALVPLSNKVSCFVQEPHYFGEAEAITQYGSSFYSKPLPSEKV
jgi:hypothetical protein